MQIVYCDTCGLRIPDKEFEAGRAVKTGERNFCEKCAPKTDARRLTATPVPLPKIPSAKTDVAHAPPRSSAAGLTPAQRYGINHGAEAREQRHAPATPSKAGLPVLPVALGVGALVLGGVLMLGGGSTPVKSARTSTPGKDERVSGIETAKPASPASAAAPTASPLAANPHASSSPAAATPDPDTSRLPANDGPNPEKLAEDALDKVLKFEGLAPDDKEGRIKVLTEYLAVHGNTMVSTRAWQFSKSLHAEVDREARERQMALSIPASVITGSIETSNEASNESAQRSSVAGDRKKGGSNPPAAPPGNAIGAGGGGQGEAKPGAAGEKAAQLNSAPAKTSDDKAEFKKAAAPPALNPAAQAQLEAVRKELAPILQQQHFGAAMDLLERKMIEPAVADAKELLQADKADLDAVLQLRQAAINAVRDLAGKKITLKRGKTELSGSVNVDPARPGIVLKSDAGMEMTFSPDQFQAQDIDAFAPLRSGSEKSGDLRARGIMFFDINDVAKAREYLKSAQDAGANVAAYLDRIAAAEEEGIEARARIEFASADSAYQIKRYEAAQKAFQSFKTNYSKTKTFAQLEPQLKLRLDAIEFTLHPLVEGLNAKYYRNRDVKDEDLLMERIDDKIDFNWDQQAPAGNVPREDFSARWTGIIRIERGGKYTFTTIADDNARLWIDGKQVINDWGGGHPPKPVSGSIELPEGFHELKLEYCQYNGGAELRFMWALKDTFPEALVPAEVLFHRQPRKSYDK